MGFVRNHKHSVRKSGSTPSVRFALGRKGRLGVLCALAIALGFALATPARAAESTVDPNLPKLEMKLFQHEYPKDELDARLDRIEKMVFGERKAGSVSERIANL